MRDKTLIKIALTWSLIGIVALLFVSEFHETEKINIIELGEYIGKIVYVQGNVTKTIYSDAVTIFEIEDNTGEIKVVAFEKMNKTINENDEIRAFGKVKIYKNELEVIADKIDCVKCG